MKHLNEYINESILSDFEDQDINEVIKKSIEIFLDDNYVIKGSYKITKKDDKFIVDVNGSVEIENEQISSLTNGAFEFGVVKGYFSCYNCKSLKSLEGAPKKVDRSFDCFRCNSLTSLKGAPEEVGGDFYCSFCDGLESLEGTPNKINRDFSCNNCKSLKSLEGAPEEVTGIFSCNNCKSLKSLEGAPKKVHVFNCVNRKRFKEEYIRTLCDVESTIRC